MTYLRRQNNNPERKVKEDVDSRYVERNDLDCERYTLKTLPFQLYGPILWTTFNNEETVYFNPSSLQEFLVLICSISQE